MNVVLYAEYERCCFFNNIIYTSTIEKIILLNKTFLEQKMIDKKIVIAIFAILLTSKISFAMIHSAQVAMRQKSAKLWTEQSKCASGLEKKILKKYPFDTECIKLAGGISCQMRVLADIIENGKCDAEQAESCAKRILYFYNKLLDTMTENHGGDCFSFVRDEQIRIYKGIDTDLISQ